MATRHTLKLVFFAGILAAINACSPSASGPVAMAYHNTTSHYNAYFLARERLKELEMGLLTSEKDNFNAILNVYPKVDCTFAKANKEKFDKIIKNSSLPIQWHKKSHWVDDCYLIIGKIRFYDMDRDNAVTTFRFVNNRFKDMDVKHEALIWLMKTYMEMGDYQGARDMGDYLENQSMIPPNLGYLSLANAHYHITQKEYKEALLKLKVGAKYIKPRPYRAKIYYIIGQLAQQVGEDKEAIKYYELCSKTSNQSSGYEMWFNARLNTYLLKEFKDEKDLDKTFKFYRKMLRDIKNEDYKDKIYYDMGTVQARIGKLEEAIDNYKLSVRNSKKNPFVKSFAYLRIADIYYDKMQKYENASVYYDSTIQILDKKVAEYPKAFRRQKVLAQFVKELKIVRREDSLQKLAKMDTASLAKLVNKWIADEDKKLMEDEKQQQKLARAAEAQVNTGSTDPFANTSSATQTPAAPSTGGDVKWYFYDASLLEIGKQDFAKKWGSRPNEDNWRRINKEREDPLPIEAAPTTIENKNTKAIDDTTASVKKPQLSVGDRKKKYYDQIPLTSVQMDSSQARLRRSLFRVARMYDQSLEEYPNAIKTYTRYIDEFKEDEKRAEVMYSIYLICKNKLAKDSCSSTYSQRLLSEYTNSLYANLIRDPDYLQKNKLKGEKVKALYREAFEYFEEDQFLLAQNTVDETLAKYPGSDFEDRMVLLRAMVVGKTQSVDNYRDALKAFIKRFEKESKLIPHATDLLAKANKIAKSDSLGKVEKRITWDLDLNYPHYFCIITTDKSKINDLIARFNTYNNEFYTDEKLKIVQANITDSVFVVAVQSFPNKIQGLNYYEKQTGRSSPLRTFPDAKFDYFTISDKNYGIMIREKKYKSYLDFFKKNY